MDCTHANTCQFLNFWGATKACCDLYAEELQQVDLTMTRMPFAGYTLLRDLLLAYLN